MDIVLPFEKYPLKIYITPFQISVQMLYLRHNWQDEDCDYCLTNEQKSFFSSLFKNTGIQSIETSMNQLLVYKFPSYTWESIDLLVISIIKNTEITNATLQVQTKQIIEKWKD